MSANIDMPEVSQFYEANYVNMIWHVDIHFFHKENRGFFLESMKSKNIGHIFITPHCPYKNGKIERIWPGIEQHCAKWTDIHRWILRYNTKPHKSLPDHLIKGKHIHLAPYQAFKRLTKWAEGMKHL